MVQPSPSHTTKHTALTLPFVTTALAALNILAWCLVAIFNAVAHGSNAAAAILQALIHRVDSMALLSYGAINGATLRSGEWWRIVTSQFLHVEPAHMLFNLVGLILLGSVLEGMFGHWRFAVLYSAAGTSGQLASVLFAPTLVTSGPSQAVIGLAGVCVPALLLKRHLDGTRWLALVVIALVWTSLQSGLDLVSAGGIKPGHAVGFLSGFALALVLCPLQSSNARR